MFMLKNNITAIDTHTVGEPTRIITAGFPRIPGSTIPEKCDYVNEHLDDLRRLIMLEPRGHADMYGCILTEPVTEDGDFGMLFPNNDSLSPMCGHATIGVTTVLIETGIISAQPGVNVVKLDSPAGRVTAYADVDENGLVKHVRFQNVPSFVYMENISVELEEYGTITGDIVYCGCFYTYVDAAQFGLTVDPQNITKLKEVGVAVKKAVETKYAIQHPIETGVNWLYGTMLLDQIVHNENEVHAKNVCIFADGEVDRCPTGTGTSGRVAQLWHKGVLKKGDILVNKSIINTEFTSRIVEELQIADYRSVVVEVCGNAYITGFNNLVLDKRDPLARGFRL